jgi:uncharacterized protein (DUF2235 family)
MLISTSWNSIKMVIGFSSLDFRGAYTIRALAGALHAYGLLCPGNGGHIPYLLRLYSNASRKAYSKGQKQIPTDSFSEAFKETYSRTIPVHFVGVWDTVSSVGWIYDPVKLLYDGQNPIVQIGRHAISIDERRCFFQDNLWGDPLPASQTPMLGSAQQDIVQVWFPGVHSDIGGSYPQRESAPAQTALTWIIEEAEKAGLVVCQEKLKAILGHGTRQFPALTAFYQAPKSMWRLHRSLTPAWWLPELLPHKYFDNKGRKRWQLAPWAHRRELRSGSLLHPSVQQMIDHDSKYRPKNLDLECLVPLALSPITLPEAAVEQQLAREGFLVYRPTQREVRPLRRAASFVACLATVAILVRMMRR